MTSAPDPARPADYVCTSGPRQTGKTVQTWPHYFSTYCMHGRHGECRLTCKHCQAPCLCVCHKDGPASVPGDGTLTHNPQGGCES